MTVPTTLSNPKEMLGYLIIQWIYDIRTSAKSVFYDRKAPSTLVFEIELLDSQLSTFRDDMYWVDKEKFAKLENPKQNNIDYRLNYWATREKIKPLLKSAEEDVYGRDYTKFREGTLMWLELIASVYPKMGLVPETGEVLDSDEFGGVVSTDYEKELTNDEETSEGDNNDRVEEQEPPTKSNRKPVGDGEPDTTVQDAPVVDEEW